PIGQGNFTFDLRFPGQVHDNETGLNYNMARDYRPDAGRYVQSDPMGLFAGVNTYGYVGQNPLRRIDPWGLDYQASFGVGVTAALVMLGGGGNLSVGINIPTNPWYIGGYQLFVAGQLDIMAGSGGFVGAGVQAGLIKADAPLPGGLSASSGSYA